MKNNPLPAGGDLHNWTLALMVGSQISWPGRRPRLTSRLTSKRPPGVRSPLPLTPWFPVGTPAAKLLWIVWKPLVESDWLRTELQNIWPTRQEELCGVLELERLEGMAGETGQLQFVLRPRVCLRKREPSIRENKANISLANSATYVGFTELVQTWTMIRVDNYKQWYTFCSNDSQSIPPIAKQFKW